MPALLALLAYVALEIWVLVLVGQTLGVLGLLGLLVASALVGAWALRREGRRSFSDLGQAVRSGRPAEAEVADGMYVALAGVLLIVPGLLSTVAALVLLVPPVRRALARRAAARAVRAGSARMGPTITVVGAGASTPGAGGAARDPWRGRVIEGHVIEDDVTEGRVVRGDVTEGDVTEGDVTEGRVIEGHVVEGPGGDPDAPDETGTGGARRGG